MDRRTVAILLACAGLSTSAFATTESAIWPWQLLSGGYDSSINDGRILAYPPPATPLGAGFFALVENSIMTMTADNGGWSRSATASNPLCTLECAQPLGCWPQCTEQNPFSPGDVWENSNGGRGFTDSFCGGYTDGCEPAGTSTGDRLGIVLAGPPSVMDDSPNNYSPADIAAGGWPNALRVALPGLQSAMDPTDGSAVCLAPAGLPNEQAHECAPGLTYRTGFSHLFFSPDAGRQWYPFASSCDFSRGVGADQIAADPASPGHLVTSGPRDPCGGPFGACNARQIAWTGDISLQLITSISATTSPLTQATTQLVDAAGGALSDDDPAGWHYAALGHLALNATGGTCDVAHAGIQKDCHARTDLSGTCHATKPSTATTSHERFCPSPTEEACQCVGEDHKLIDVKACMFPEPTSVAIDPRNGQVYAPTSNVGLLFSPDGGRKWRRHGHASFSKFDTTPSSGASTNSDEWWPYPLPAGVATATDLTELEDPGVRILTMQGLPIPAPLAPGAAVPLDLNAQPELLTHIGRLSFAVTQCPSDSSTMAGPLVNTLGSRPRVRVMATMTASWRNPIKPTQELSGVFIAHGDSCTDNNAKQPLVFRDTANLMPSAGTQLLGTDPKWSPDSEPKTLNGQGTVKLPQFQVAITDGVTPCAMHYVAAAVSPSDSRILHAWGYSGKSPAWGGASAN